MNAFIARHRQTFGLLGTNTRSLPVSESRPFDGGFSQAGHFRFGYDGGEFNTPRGNSCLFWTRYGKPQRPPEDFKSEIERAFLEIARRFGRFSIPDTGTLASEFMIRSAAKLGLDFDTLRLEIGDYKTAPLGARHTGKDRVFRLTEGEFQNALEKIAHVAPFRQIELGYFGVLESLSETPHLCDGFSLRFVNLNFDYVHDVPAGPARWALVDNERYFVTFRRMVAERRAGVPNLLKYSPELMAAFLEHPIWTESIGHNPNLRNNAHEEIRILRSLHPEIADRDFFRSPIERAPLPLTDVCERQWFTSLENFRGRSPQ